MLSVLFESALRSMMIAAVVWLALKALRVRNPHAEATAWRAVLFAAIAMPLLMQWDAILLSTPPPELLSVVRLEATSAAEGASGWGRAARWVYLVVAGALLLRPLMGIATMWRLRRRSAVVSASWTAGLDVRASCEVETPVTFGRTVLVPNDHATWDGLTRRAIVAHERMHIERGDSYVLVLAYIHRAIFWFSPLGWWLPRRLSALGEQLADDAAVRAVSDPVAYTEMLVRMAAKSTRTVGGVAMARPAGIARRIERILEREQLPSLLSPTRRMLLSAPLLPLVVGFAGCARDNAPPAQVLDAAPAAPAPMPPPHDAPPPANAQYPKSNRALPLSQPKYPAEARDAKQQGTVIVRLFVREDGTVQDVRIKESSGYASLDAAAANESLKWRLDPGTVEGKPASMWGTFAITFKLRND